MRIAIRYAISNLLKDIAVRLYDLAERISPTPLEPSRPINLDLEQSS